MKYSDYTTDQIVSQYIFEEDEDIAKKLISLAKDEETKRKMERNII